MWTGIPDVVSMIFGDGFSDLLISLIRRSQQMEIGRGRDAPNEKNATDEQNLKLCYNKADKFFKKVLMNIFIAVVGLYSELLYLFPKMAHRWLLEMPYFRVRH